MRLKIYRAASLPAAMAAIRAELGADALILGTRRVAGGVEVTAALEPERPEANPAVAAAPGAASPAAASPDAASPDAASSAPDPALSRQLSWHGVPAALAGRLAQAGLEGGLAALVRFAPLGAEQGRPLLLAGPCGAGKSLTCAKLATRLVLQGQPPMVVSTDLARAGATEQLAAFTRLLGVPLLVAADAVGLARMVAQRAPGQPVLVDTAGIDPLDPAGQAAVASLAGACEARVLVVLPAGHDPAESADAAAAFHAAGARALLPTRLDVARRLGGVLAAAAAGLALTEAGCGPGVTGGLLRLNAAELARRLLPPPARAAA